MEYCLVNIVLGDTEPPHKPKPIGQPPPPPPSQDNKFEKFFELATGKSFRNSSTKVSVKNY
jgi:hypothetical protein